MKNKLICSVLSAWLLIICMDAASQSDTEMIKQRIYHELLKPAVNDSIVEKLVTTLQNDGTWPGINYEDVSRTGFEHRIHSGNLVILARAYKNEKSVHYKSPKVKKAVESALSHWLTKDYFCDNWWHNQIGTPDNFVSLMLIMGDELPKDLVDKAQPVIGRAHLEASGARPSGDRIKIGGILAKNLLFIDDTHRFGEVMKIIEGEIKFSTGQRGMQHDYSFHHREDRVNNTLSYGSGYAEAFAEWAAYVAGTRYAFSTDKINHLIDYFLDGMCKQMVYGKTSDPGIKNRDITRPEGGYVSGTTLPERLMMSSGYRKPELQEIIKVRKGEGPHSLSFGKFFWQTEHYSHQRKNYYTSVRMYSTRNRNMEEPYNSEGLQNHHRADGTNYLSKSGSEYRNMAPVYDWQKIPGTTVMQKKEMPAETEIQKEGLTEFVGAVTNEMYGAVAFDFKSPHDPLSARKAWFFFDNEYVCLGSGITSQGALPVATTLNQCLLRGAVTVNDGHKSRIVARGEHQFQNHSWIHHDGVGYLFPEPVEVNLLNKPQSGTWYHVNRQSSSSKEEVTEDVFKLWIDHGARLQNASYAYIVVPEITVEEMGRLKNAVKIVQNNPQVQAVSHTDLGINQMIFYQAGEVELPGGITISCDSPGALMVRTNGKEVKEITVADPSRKPGRMHISASGKVSLTSKQVMCVFNKKENKTYISIELPKGVYAGKSVTID